MSKKLYVFGEHRILSNKFCANNKLFVVGESYDISRTKGHKWYYMYLIPMKNYTKFKFMIKSINDRSFIEDDDPIGYIEELGCVRVAECSLYNLKNDDSFITDDLTMMLEATNMEYLKLFELCNLYVYPKYRDNGFSRLFVDSILNNIKQGKYIVATCAGALCKEYPEKPSDDKCHEVAENIAEYYEKLDFISINDVSNFKTMHALVYNSKSAAKMLIKFYRDTAYAALKVNKLVDKK